MMGAQESQSLEPVDFGVQDGAAPGTLRLAIDNLEQVMKQMVDQQITIEPKHYFAAGLYAREITIPAGTTLTGKIHKFEHINIISKGDISVLTENGIQRIKAPATIISKPGTKRVGFAHEETVWTTLHAVSDDAEGNPEIAEQALVVDTSEQFKEWEQLEMQKLISLWEA